MIAEFLPAPLVFNINFRSESNIAFEQVTIHQSQPDFFGSKPRYKSSAPLNCLAFIFSWEFLAYDPVTICPHRSFIAWAKRVQGIACVQFDLGNDIQAILRPDSIEPLLPTRI